MPFSAVCEQVEPPVRAELVRLKPPTSPTASVHALEQVRVLVDQEAARPRRRRPPRPPVKASTMSRGGLAALAQPLAHHGQHHRVHVLHVDRAAAPARSRRATSPENGSRCPVRRRWPARRPGGRGRGGARPGAGRGPRIRATTLVRLGWRLEQRRARGLPRPAGRATCSAAAALAWAGVVAEVRGVDPDQVTADVGDLFFCGHMIRCHASMVAPGRTGVYGRRVSRGGVLGWLGCVPGRAGAAAPVGWVARLGALGLLR